jgi:predicted Zn finger-like uncharacterized protein
MSLATRCFACGTVFRVVQDQLKVSEGWVRCGRCNEVFNALDSLFDLERDTAPVWPATEPALDNPPATAEASAASTALEDAASDRIDERLSNSWRSNTTPATRVDERDRLEFPDAQFDPEFSIGMLSDNNAEATTLPLTSEPPAAAPTLTMTPEFVRHAQQRARWQSPIARVTLAVGGVLLLVALGLQMGHHFRDLVAARWPQTRPALQAWCDLLTCSIQPPRRIEDIAVESTALTKAAGPVGADAFKLSVALRNRGNIPLAMPSIDLTLTDPLGQLVARRVLAPNDFRVAQTAIQPAAEVPLQLLLTTGNARVTGYTVEVFYP